MSAPQIQPFNLRKPTGKLAFQMFQCTFQLIRGGLAMTMAMKTFNSLRQCLRQQVCRYSKTGTWRTWIIKFSFHFRVFGIYTNTTWDTASFGNRHRIETFELGHRVECDMTTTTHDFRKILLRIGRRIRMCLAPELFQRQTSFIHRTGCWMTYVFTEYRKRTPHGKRLESKDNLHSRPVGHAFDQCKVLS